ncbi:MAG: hypothetical protein ACQESR_14260 [Planctomycetota bacterium]
MRRAAFHPDQSSRLKYLPLAHDFVRRQSDQREDGLRGAAFHPDQSSRLKYLPLAHDFVRRQSDQREDGLRGAAFHPDQSSRLKYTSHDHKPHELHQGVPVEKPARRAVLR